MKDVFIVLFVVWLLGMLLISVVDDKMTYDNTDNLVTEKRSGLRLYTDYGTGLQYIKGGMFGSMIPRLDKSGKHINIKDIK